MDHGLSSYVTPHCSYVYQIAERYPHIGAMR